MRRRSGRISSPVIILGALAIGFLNIIPTSEGAYLVLSFGNLNTGLRLCILALGPLSGQSHGVGFNEGIGLSVIVGVRV